MAETGAEILFRILREEGCSKIFGNPGTTELPLMDALASAADAPEYVLGLNEGTVVGMADGYAQATGQPAFLNLHAAGGLGCAMGALSNAAAANVPMVVTAGQQDRRHLAYDPWLCGDLVSLARPFTKWAHEVRDVDELEIMLRRAFLDAQAPAPGPVFLSLPMDIMLQKSTSGPTPRSFRQLDACTPNIRPLADKLAKAQPGKLAIVLCDEVAVSGAIELAKSLAELLDADVYGASLHGRYVYPTHHAAWRGSLPPDFEVIRNKLEEYTTVFAIGSRPFIPYAYKEGKPLAAGIDFCQLAPVPTELGRSFSTSLGVAGEIKATLKALNSQLASQIADRRRSSIRSTVLASPAPTQVDLIADRLLRALPPDAVVVDEAPMLISALRGAAARYLGPNRYYFVRGGALGWGMPAAVGVAMTNSKPKVLCLIGDGAAVFSPQALWSAAQLELNVVFVVLQNGQYSILKDFLRKSGFASAKENKFVAMDIDNPSLDFIAMGKAFGVAAYGAQDAHTAGSLLREAFSRTGPSLIVLKV